MIRTSTPTEPTSRADSTASSGVVVRKLPGGQDSESTVAENGDAHFGASRSFDGSDAASVEPDRTVWLHIYHCDAYTGFLNRAVLKSSDMPIYHAGVEVFDHEWSFQYYEDAWDNDAISGVVRCRPKHMTDYEYQESVCLGATALSEDEVDVLLLALNDEWPASGYHLTRRNCLTFAEHFVGLLRTPEAFPSHLRWIDAAYKSNPNTDAVVDYAWGWSKWYMLRKHRRPEPEDDPPPTSGGGIMPFWTCGHCTGAALCSPSMG